jgi:hypothetical protein
LDYTNRKLYFVDALNGIVGELPVDDVNALYRPVIQEKDTIPTALVVNPVDRYVIRERERMITKDADQ